MRKLLLVAATALLVAFEIHAYETTGRPPAYTICSDVSYGQLPGEKMDIYVPGGSKPRAAIVVIHGGGWIGGDKSVLSPIAKQLAGGKFVVANINYRIASPDGNHYPVGLGDCRSAIGYLESHAAQYRIDPRHIIALGTSAGGNLAVELGLAGAVQAVADFYGPVDFNDGAFLANRFDGQSNSEIASIYLGASQGAKPGLYTAASPLNRITGQMPPTIIFHGMHDQVVPVAQSVALDEKLRSDKVVSELHLEPDRGHGFLTNAEQPGIYLTACTSFFQKHLR